MFMFRDILLTLPRRLLLALPLCPPSLAYRRGGGCAGRGGFGMEWKKNFEDDMCRALKLKESMSA